MRLRAVYLSHTLIALGRRKNVHHSGHTRIAFRNRVNDQGLWETGCTMKRVWCPLFPAVKYDWLLYIILQTDRNWNQELYLVHFISRIAFPWCLSVRAEREGNLWVGLLRQSWFHQMSRQYTMLKHNFRPYTTIDPLMPWYQFKLW